MPQAATRTRNWSACGSGRVTVSQTRTDGAPNRGRTVARIVAIARSADHGASILLAMPGCVPVRVFEHLASLEERGEGVSPGEADAAVDVNAIVQDGTRHVP